MLQTRYLGDTGHKLPLQKRRGATPQWDGAPTLALSLASRNYPAVYPTGFTAVARPVSLLGPLRWRLLLPNSAFSWLIGTLIPVSLLHHWRPTS